MTLKQCLLISASILILGASAKNNAQVKGNKPYELSCFRITEERINLPPMGFQDTPKIKSPWRTGKIIIGDHPQAPAMIQLAYTGIFWITDSTGIQAERDTSGNWTIKDPARALEVFYQTFIKDKRRL